MKVMWPCVAAFLASCTTQDWRFAAIDDASQAIKDDLNDSAVQFQSVQVVGDSSTGQVCGKLFGNRISNSTGAPVRFIYYIDRTAGPWIEGQFGRHIVSDERFDFAWQNDCVGEGWRQ